MLSRFLKYVKIPTASNEESESCPSTKKQLVLANELRNELISLGLNDAHVDENGYVYATLKENSEGFDTVALIAHMDVSPDAPDGPVNPRIIEYTGGDIELSEGTIMRAKDYPVLNMLVGETLVVSDGKTLLGADDKAGIAEIMTALEVLSKSDTPHGTVKVCFTPDEEIGRGADLFDVKKLGADYGYTVDGGPLGELEYENFNAASAKIKINGVNIHPGAAKDKMKNASLIAIELNSMLPQNAIPERTEGYEGFNHLIAISGEVESASLAYIIRDHDREKFEAKKKDFERIANELNKKYGDGTVELTLTDSYYNMKEVIEEHMYTVERAKAAMKSCGVTPRISAIRGGTDGARLSFMGLPCPNLSTGGYNFHSRFEFASLTQMEKMVDVLVRIITTAKD